MTTAFITLLTNESYLAGALTLGNLLKKNHKTTHKVAILIDKQSLSKSSIDLILSVFDDVIDISDRLIKSLPIDTLTKLGRPELSHTFNKIHIWDLIQYSTVIYLDSDTLPIKSLDHLFDKYGGTKLKQGSIAASPDSGWPDIFNSGLIILNPNHETYEELKEFLTNPINTFDGADQGLLNEYFNLKSNGKNWHRLPFLYNVTPTDSYQYTPAYDRFVDQIQLIHFIGGIKPWHGKSHSNKHHELWWKEFEKHFTKEEINSILGHGEGKNLKFTKTENVWDEEINEESGEIEDSKANIPPVFPWEHRDDQIPASRTFKSFKEIEQVVEDEFNSISTSIKKNIESLGKLSLGKIVKDQESLKDKYNIDSNEGDQWDPIASFDKVSKLPSKFLSKEEKKD